jgi:hypothetical protein
VNCALAVRCSRTASPINAPSMRHNQRRRCRHHRRGYRSAIAAMEKTGRRRSALGPVPSQKYRPSCRSSSPVQSRWETALKPVVKVFCTEPACESPLMFTGWVMIGSAVVGLMMLQSYIKRDEEPLRFMATPKVCASAYKNLSMPQDRIKDAIPAGGYERRRFLSCSPNVGKRLCSAHSFLSIFHERVDS